MRRPRRPRSAQVAFVAAAALLGPAEPPARACGWDWETYHAEAKSLPCVFDALLGYWPKHTPEYHQARIDAADQALRWVPGWAEGLDAKGLSLLRLGRMEPAEAVMKQRLALDPDAYPGHANLGTLYTFTGDYPAALEHIDRAMAIEPQAHFGREKYHRALVVFLQRAAEDPAVARTENFLAVALTDAQRTHGSRATFRRLGLEDDVFDALVSMITVYGADEVAEIYLALGEALAARGHRRLAYTAYRRAKELGHVRRKELQRWMKELDALIEQEFKGEIASGARRSAMPESVRGRLPHGMDNYRGIGPLYARNRGTAKQSQTRWAKWERERLEEGLPIWTQAGLDELYARMNEQRRRCSAPRIIEDAQAPLAEPEPEPGEQEGGEPKPEPDADANAGGKTP
ncbi:MAG: hypothetical protein KDK70_31960 [Myxococcales bacterium]|nr:hypothetical protein [Myxococcales bacterium]